MTIESCYIIYKKEIDKQSGRFRSKAVMVELTAEGAEAYMSANSRSPEERMLFWKNPCKLNNVKSHKTTRVEAGVIDVYPPYVE